MLSDNVGFGRSPFHPTDTDTAGPETDSAAGAPAAAVAVATDAAPLVNDAESPGTTTVAAVNNTGTVGRGSCAIAAAREVGAPPCPHEEALKGHTIRHEMK